MKIPLVSPSDLYQRLQTTEEIALLDIREQGVFAQGHILQASCLPLGHFEDRLAGMVVRHDTPIILVSDVPSAPYRLPERAFDYLKRSGYTRVFCLEGGITGWDDAGYQVFTGINTLSKAFGEFVETNCHTPNITAPELKCLLDADDNVMVFDARPEKEFYRNAIPAAINLPGVELIYRVFDMVRDPATLIVVNCAGRTRSIIGAQSLVNLGIENQVAALKNGIMGWHLAGFDLAYKRHNPLQALSAEGSAAARAAVSTFAGRFEIKRINEEQLRELKNQQGRRRNIYLFDVRTPAEYEAGHLPGSKSAPGGQLIQATDDYLAVRNGIVILIDNDGVRASMTASWLLQMGLPDVYILQCGNESDSFTVGDNHKLKPSVRESAAISVDHLREIVPAGEVLVLDLASSKTYREGHIPGAAWLIRSRIEKDLENEIIPLKIVVTSSSSAQAIRAGRELQHCYPDANVRVLEGGTAAWIDRGYELEVGMTRPLSAIEDLWYRPYEQTTDQESAMRRYLEWEIGLLESVTREAGVPFIACEQEAEA